MQTPPQAVEFYARRQSLFQAMERFVSAVGEMDGTVMVPSLLRDLPARHATGDLLTGGGGGYSSRASTTGAATTTSTAVATQERDLFSLYAQLKSVRSQIEWGALPPTAALSGGVGLPHNNNNSKKKQQQQQNRNARKTTYNNLATSSTSKQHLNGGIQPLNAGDGLAGQGIGEEVVVDDDDGDDDDEEEDDDVEQRFRLHVTGLHAALHEMTQLALGLTRRYKQEINLGAM